MREQSIYASHTVRLSFPGCRILQKGLEKYAAAESRLGDMHGLPRLRLCLKEGIFSIEIFQARREVSGS